MAKQDPLTTYREKRDFRVSPEPTAGGARRKRAGAPTFVVQKHAARSLHYDFRLEVDGVLASWAVPKGPSTDPADKRLAAPTEDHPLDYGGFEGVIPEGYGAGAVIVWDRGTYRNLREQEGISMAESLAEGKVEVWLDGEKLRGGYVLVEMKGRGGWLLIKQDDAEARAGREIVDEQPASVLTGRSIDEVAAAGAAARTGAGNGSVAPAKAATAKETPVKRRARKATPRRRAGAAASIKVGRATVKLSSLDRVVFPDDGITKGDAVDYYHRIAEWMLPHVEDRPLTLHRFPDGIGGEGFMQQHAPAFYPKWVARATVGATEGAVTHAVANNAATLVYLANQGVITAHVWLSRVDRLDFPDRLIFDLDPPDDGPASAEEAFAPVRAGARAVRALLDEIGLPAYLMTTGSSGLHVVVPLDRSDPFDDVREFARNVAEVLVRRTPDAFTLEHRIAKRGGRLYLDVLRNAYAHTAVAPYAVRARAGAPVAMPIAWEELSDPRLHPGRYTIRNAFRRLSRLKRDPWADIRRRGHSLSVPRRRLAALAGSADAGSSTVER